MRPIKFRIWDKKEKRFYTAENTCMMNVTLDGKNTVIEWIGGAIKFVFQKPEEAGIILQQFAGVLDKDGREIYEGDIIEFHSGYPNQNDSSFYKSQAVVEFKDGAFWPRPIYDTNDEDTWYDYELKDLRVLGNIFENIDLLN